MDWMPPFPVTGPLCCSPGRELQGIQVPPLLAERIRQTVDVEVMWPNTDDADLWLTQDVNALHLLQSEHNKTAQMYFHD